MIAGLVFSIESDVLTEPLFLLYFLEPNWELGPWAEAWRDFGLVPGFDTTLVLVL